MTAPPSSSPPPVPGAGRRLLRLRRESIDSNQNGLPDWWELANNFPAFTAFDAGSNDPDGDGLSTLEEFQRGTNPRKADTDGDLLSDGDEVDGGTDPLVFTLPRITLEYSWREAQGEDIRSSAASSARSITGKASNGATERPWSMTVPASSSPINAVNAVNSIMGTNGFPGPEMAWSAWTPWPGSARARWRQTLEADPNSSASPLPLIKHSFARRDLRIRLSASRNMPVAWKVHLQKTVSTNNNGQPGRQWNSQTTFSDPVTLSLAEGQKEAIFTLSPADTANPGLPTSANPLNEALVEYSISSIGVPPYPNSLDTDGDGLPNATESKIGTSPTVFSSPAPGPGGLASGLSDSHDRVEGLSSPAVQLVAATRSVSGYCNTTQGYLTFARSWSSPPAPQYTTVTSYPGFNTKLDALTFPASPFAALGEQWNADEMYCRTIATQFIPSGVGTAHWAYLEQKRIWAIMTPAPKENISRSFLRVTTNPPYGSAAQKTAEVVTLQFTANQSISTNYTELKPTFTEAHTGAWIEMRLLSVEVRQPSVFPDGSYESVPAPVNDVHLCRWNSPRVPSGDLADAASFPAEDPDRIIIRIPLPHKAGQGPLRIHVSTDGAQNVPGGSAAASLYNDPGADIELTETVAGGGVLESKPIVIVADKDDDKWEGGRMAQDGALNDPTLIGWPGGKLRIKVPDLNNAIIDFPIKKFSHSFTCYQIFAGDVLNDQISVVAINENMRRLFEIYAPLHQRVDLPQEEVARITQADLNAIVGADNKLDISESKALVAKIDTLGLPVEAIKVIFISKTVLQTTIDDQLDSGVNGGQNHIYVDGRGDIVMCFLSGVALSPGLAKENDGTVAHECGHSLRGAGHGETGGIFNPKLLLRDQSLPGWHLMSSGVNKHPLVVEMPVRSRKHWYLQDEEIVHSAPGNKYSKKIP